MNRNSEKRRRLAAVLAGILLLAGVLGGTYAWRNYRQHKTNEADADAIFYKARLVEKYDATKARNWKITDPAVDKQISVKNPGAETSGDARVYGDVYVRIQLKEFMELYPVTQEYTPNRYMIDEDGDFYAFDSAAEAQAFVDDLETKYGSGPHIIEQVRMYLTPVSVSDGDLPWYIRTMQGDPNGVYGDFIVIDELVDRETNFRSLVTGVRNAKEDQETYHQDDINTSVDTGTSKNNGECLYTPHQWQSGLFEWLPTPTGIVGENFFQYIHWVYGEDVVLASQWNGQPIKKWIVDDSASNTQGWVYWGYALAPKESTSNFMEQIQLVAQPDDAFYYAIHVDMQAVSYNELTRWDKANDTSGNDEIVAALVASGMKVTAMTISPSNIADAYLGETQQFQASVLGTVGVPQNVEWTLAGSNGGSFISNSGLLTVGTNETAATLTVTATSKTDPSKSASIKLNVVLKPIVTDVEIDPAGAPFTVSKGGVQTFTALVSGQNITQRVSWSVADNDSVKTVINQYGVLTVGSDETAAQIRIIVTTVDKDAAGGVKTDEVIVTVA